MFPRFAQTHPLIAAALLILVSELFLVLSGLSIKQVSQTIPTPEIVFMRNLIGVALMTPWLVRNGTGALKTEILRFHILRAAVGVAAMTCLYFSWGHLPLAQAALLKQTAPFFTPLIAIWWLGERISTLTKWSLLLGFVGVVAVLNPQQGVINTAAVVAVLGALLGATAKVTVRRLAITEGAQRIVFYFAVFSSVLAAGPALYYWVTPSLIELGWFSLLAITSTLAQLLLSKGYSLAPAGQLGPFTYASIVFAALLGWLFWDELLSWNTFIGIVLIVGAGLMAMQGGTKTAKEKPAT